MDMVCCSGFENEISSSYQKFEYFIKFRASATSYIFLRFGACFGLWVEINLFQKKKLKWIKLIKKPIGK